MICHKSEKLNKDADALSRRHLLLSTLDSRVVVFKMIKDEYKIDKDLKELFDKCSHHLQGAFHLDQGFLLKGSQLCIPNSGIRESLIQKIHRGALAGYFEVDKTCQFGFHHRALLSTTQFTSPLGGCQFGFHHRAAKTIEEKSFYHGSGR